MTGGFPEARLSFDALNIHPDLARGRKGKQGKPMRMGNAEQQTQRGMNWREYGLAQRFSGDINFGGMPADIAAQQNTQNATASKIAGPMQCGFKMLRPSHFLPAQGGLQGIQLHRIHVQRSLPEMDASLGDYVPARAARCAGRKNHWQADE